MTMFPLNMLCTYLPIPLANISPTTLWSETLSAYENSAHPSRSGSNFIYMVRSALFGKHRENYIYA